MAAPTPEDAADAAIPVVHQFAEDDPPTGELRAVEVPSTRPVRGGGIRRTNDEFVAPFAARAGGAATGPVSASVTGPVSAGVSDAVLTDARPPARSAPPRATVNVLCRACSTPFERPASVQGAAVCPTCCEISAEVGRISAEDVLASAGAPPEEPVAPDVVLPPAQRPRPFVAQRPERRIAPLVAAGVLVLVLAGAAFALLRGETDRSVDLLRSARVAEASVRQEFAPGAVLRHLVTLKLHAIREDSGPLTPATKALDVRQTTEQETEAAFVAATDAGPCLDVAVDATVIQQSGRIGADDASAADLYPWGGHHAVVRVTAAAGAPLSSAEDATVSSGENVPPLFHLGALGAKTTAFRPGDRWKTKLELPLLTDRGGRLVTAQLPAEIEFHGVAVRGGIKCAAFRVTAAAPRELAAPLASQFKSAAGTVSGVVWVELATGIVAAADLDASMRLKGGDAKGSEELSVTSRLTIDRR